MSSPKAPQSEAFEEAEKYFSDLWSKGKQRWRNGDVTPAAMQDGTTIPVDYCLSTVSFAAKQTPAARKAIQEVRQRLMLAAPDQFYYLPDSTHITLLGCTRRFATPDPFTPTRVDAVQRVVADTLRGAAPVQMTLKGAGVLGNQVFIQVYPHDRRWAELREELEEALGAIGESPLTHANKAPIHMNIMRVTDASPEQLHHIFNAVADMQQTEWCTFPVSRVDLVQTDFVISPAHTRYITSYTLEKKG